LSAVKGVLALQDTHGQLPHIEFTLQV